MELFRLEKTEIQVIQLYYLLFIFCLFFREKLAKHYEETGERLVDLGSDQTSLHNPFNGGYYPVQVDLNICLV